MDETQFLGYLVSAVITLGAFFLVIQRFTQPINDLLVAIQELRDWVKSLRDNSTNQALELKEHRKEIEDLKDRVNTVETKVDMYHGK